MSAGLGALWFTLFSGPVLWTVLELVEYPVGAQSCYPGLVPLSHPLIGSGVHLIDGIWALASVIIQIIAVIVALRNWQTARRAEPREDQVGIRVRFMALGGLIVSLTFLEAIILTGLGIILSHPCSG